MQGALSHFHEENVYKCSRGLTPEWGSLVKAKDKNLSFDVDESVHISFHFIACAVMVEHEIRRQRWGWRRRRWRRRWRRRRWRRRRSTFQNVSHFFSFSLMGVIKAERLNSIDWKKFQSKFFFLEPEKSEK